MFPGQMEEQINNDDIQIVKNLILHHNAKVKLAKSHASLIGVSCSFKLIKLGAFLLEYLLQINYNFKRF